MTNSRREISILRPPRIRSVPIRKLLRLYGGDVKHSSL
jgi:hypothetical protein